MADEVNLDELWQQGIDTDELAKGAKDLLMPVGTYRSVPPMTLSFNDQEDEFSGRKPGSQANVFGEFQMVVRAKDLEKVHKTNPDAKVGDVLARGYLGVRLSPIRVNVKDRETGRDTGRPDRAYQLWINAVAAFKKAYGREPGSQMEVLRYLTDYEFQARVGQYNVPTEKNPEPEGNPGNNVQSISAVQEER